MTFCEHCNYPVVHDECDRSDCQLIEAQKKLAIAIKALEYYSHPERKRQVEVWEMSLLVDRGDKAREALEKLNYKHEPKA